MCGEKEKLAFRKKIRTYSKRLVTTLSTAFLIGYIATLVFNISSFSLHFSIAGTILSAISLALNIWSLADHFRKQDANKQTGIENIPEQKKLPRIYLDVTSSASFLVGGVTSLIDNTATLSLYGSSIIPYISTSFFVLGYFVMAINTIRWLTDSTPQTDTVSELEIDQIKAPCSKEALIT